MESLYIVCFCGDGSAYYFHKHEHAIEFAWEAYCDDYSMEDPEVTDNDHKTLIEEDFIEDYCWI